MGRYILLPSVLGVSDRRRPRVFLSIAFPIVQDNELRLVLDTGGVILENYRKLIGKEYDLYLWMTYVADDVYSSIIWIDIGDDECDLMEGVSLLAKRCALLDCIVVLSHESCLPRSLVANQEGVMRMVDGGALVLDWREAADRIRAKMEGAIRIENSTVIVNSKVTDSFNEKERDEN